MSARAPWLTPRVLDGVAAACVLGAVALLVLPARVTIAPVIRPAPVPTSPMRHAATLDLGTLVAHNPFSPARRAPTQRFIAPGLEPAPDLTAPPAAVSSSIDADMPQLLGVLRVDGSTRALVQIAPDSAPRLVAVGARIGRWRVSVIARTQVTLLSAAGPRTVRLARPTSSDSSPPRP